MSRSLVFLARRSSSPSAATRSAASLSGVLMMICVAGQSSAAQVSPTQQPLFSIGQPSLWQHDAGATVGGGGGRSRVRLAYGLHHPFTNPVTGLVGGVAEAFASIGASPAGLRLLGESKVIGLSAGVDWSVTEGRLSPLVRFETAVRRGGLLGRGTMLRVEWLTSQSGIAAGMSVPLLRPLAGRTRPRQTAAHLAVGSVAESHDDNRRIATPGDAPDAPDAPHAPDAREAREAAALIAAFTNVYSSRAEARLAAHHGTFAGALDAYDRSLLRLFAASGIDARTASRIVERGRAAILDRILLPVDTLFGQPKDDARDLRPLVAAAERDLSRWLADSGSVAADRQPRVLSAFRAWTAAIADIYDEILDDTGDSRLVWMPMTLALRAEQFDEQPEVDSLLARAVGHPFTDQNALTYLRSTDLPLEIARSIYATRDYHVLWTHDFTGRRENGAIDNIGYSMVADAYLPALTAAVKRYDSTGVLPTYIVLQDEFFYEPRDNRLWMDILENPLHAAIRLRGDTSAAREAHLRERQEELRRAVAASSALQRDAAASGSAEHWIRERVKVHVNIVEPSDFSFRSRRIIPGIPFTPDNVMRDHRKLVLYDLNEADPYRGSLLIMGVGIGEHYASATWEDRGYRVRGPATLEARRAAREALLHNGFRADQIPVSLRPVASAAAAEHRMNAGDYVGRALQVHNEVGFARKESSIARAMMYDLAPAGSVIIAPDPMWMSDTWAGMLAAAAARGCRVHVIAPAAANAPSPQAPLLATQRTVLARLLALREHLAPKMRESGGDLRVGMFAAEARADDPAGRAGEIRAGLARAPWIRQVIPFDDATLGVLASAERSVAEGANSTALARDAVPRAQQLHQKSQLVARPGAIAALVRQPGWDAVLARSIRVQTEQTAKFTEQLGWRTPEVDTTAARNNDALLRGYERSLPENERRRFSFYFSLGTQNQDPRGIVSDAEATMIVSGAQASAGLVDLFYLMARSTWIDDLSGLDRFNPPKPGWLTRLAWAVRAAF